MSLTVQSHARQAGGDFALEVRVPDADVAALSCVPGTACQDGDDVLVTLVWSSDAPVEQQLVETRRLIEFALAPPADPPEPTVPVVLAEPGTEL